MSIVLGNASRALANSRFREEEDPDDYAFPLTLKSPKKSTPVGSPKPATVNGTSRNQILTH